MKTSKFYLRFCAVILLLSFTASAQERLQLKFNVKCVSTNEAGQPIKQTINNATLIKEFADKNGLTNANNLALVYHLNGDERGDVIEIVNTTDGELRSQVFGLLFPVDLPTGDGSQLTRYVYMYNDQQSISMGGAMLRERITTDKHGEIRRVINGDLHYYLLPNSSNGLRMCSGTITASKLFVTNAPPLNPGTNIFQLPQQ